MLPHRCSFPEFYGYCHTFILEEFWNPSPKQHNSLKFLLEMLNVYINSDRFISLSLWVLSSRNLVYFSIFQVFLYTPQ